MSVVMKTDPATGGIVNIYHLSNFPPMCGIGRKITTAWDYLWPDLTWKPNLYSFKDFTEAEACFDKYVASLNYQPSPGEPMAVALTILPLLIDTAKLRLKIKCPKCEGIHIFATKAEGNNWKGTSQIIERSCRKDASAAKFGIKLWNVNRDDVTAPVGSITPLPDADCQECWSSGQVTLFTSVGRCKCCVD